MFNLFFQSAPARLTLTSDLACIVVFEGVWGNRRVFVWSAVCLWGGDDNQAVLQKLVIIVPELNVAKCIPQVEGVVVVEHWLDEWHLMYNPHAMRLTCQTSLFVVFLAWQRAHGRINFPAVSLSTTIVHILSLFPIIISLSLTQTRGKIISHQVDGVMLIILTLSNVVFILGNPCSNPLQKKSLWLPQSLYQSQNPLPDSG